MAHGWNGEMSLAIRLKNSIRELKERHSEAASYLGCHTTPDGGMFAK
jgi:hypothetical protein